MENEGKGSVTDSLLSKLEEFGGKLNPQERAAFLQLVGPGGEQPVEAGRVSKEELRTALDFLAAHKLGRVEINRMRDEGFWAQWSQRQY